MNDLVVKKVDLCGDMIMAAQDKDGQVWAGVKWLCEGLGLTKGQMQNERVKIQEDVVLKEGERNFVLPTKGGKQEVLCLRHDFIPLWIAKITVTPAMKENNPELVNKLMQYQLKAKDVLAEAFLPKKKEKQDKPKKESRASVNMTVKTIDTIFSRAGVDPLYIAVEAKRIYAEAGYDIKIPLIADKETMLKLYDCTSLAEAVGAYSEKGNPHTKAISAILQKLTILESEIVTTPYSRNGHDGVTIQYKPSVLEKVREWTEVNYYPTKIPYTDSKGKQTMCTVVYREM